MEAEKKGKTNQEKRRDTERRKEKRQSGLSVPEIVLRERRIAVSEIVRECVRSILSGEPWSWRVEIGDRLTEGFPSPAFGFIMTSLHCFSSAASAATAKGSGCSASNSNRTASSSANLLSSTTTSSTVAPAAAPGTSALATASSGGGADYDLASPGNLFGPWVELSATPTNSLNPFLEPPPGSASHPHHPPSRPPYRPSHPTHSVHSLPSANSCSLAGSGAKHPPTPKSLPPSHKVLPSSLPNSEVNTKSNKRPTGVVASPSSSLCPPPSIRLSEREALNRSIEGGATGSLKRETPVEGDAGDDTMSVHSQGNNHDDKPSSRIATSAFFPEIPRILPHEKVREPLIQPCPTLPYQHDE